jgi:hypothetical protein
LLFNLQSQIQELGLQENNNDIGNWFLGNAKIQGVFRLDEKAPPKYIGYLCAYDVHNEL